MSYYAVGAALVAAAGTLYNQDQVAGKQDRAAGAAIREQTSLQNQANLKTNNLINQVSDSTPDASKSKLMQAYTDQLNTKHALSNSNLAQVGKVSDAYTKSANDASSGIANYGNTTAGLLSSIDAPGLQRQNEASNLSQYASALGGIQQQSNAANQMEQLKLSTITPNPWVSALTSAAQAYAMKGGMNSGLTSSPAGGTTDTGYIGTPMFNGATGSGTYVGNGSQAVVWPGMKNGWGG